MPNQLWRQVSRRDGQTHDAIGALQETAAAVEPRVLQLGHALQELRQLAFALTSRLAVRRR
jgi:hypothetical protein